MFRPSDVSHNKWRYNLCLLTVCAATILTCERNRNESIILFGCLDGTLVDYCS